MSAAAEADAGRRPSRRDLPLLVRARVRQGRARVAAGWFPILQAAVAGAVAFAIAHFWFGHPYPFFAPVSAWIALGFTMDRSVRRVAELAVGVAIGVALGEVVAVVIGQGALQVGLVLFVSAVLARFLDRGGMLTTQAGVQAIVIVSLPAAAGGPFGRWVDAALGGAVALAVALLTPSDPRRHPRALGQAALDELAGVLHGLARGLTDRSVGAVEDALVRGRASQPALDEWSEQSASARDLARVSPAARRFADELAALVGSAVLADRAMRNARVLARRALAVVQADVLHDATGLGVQVEATAAAVDELAAAVGTGHDPERAREQLLAVAGSLDPFALAVDDWQVQSLVLLHRSLVVDLLETAGVTPRDARAVLPEI
ncbi:FUSC family protein [Cellulomonas fimi]|uniref:Membrane protein-like protein n=1 Tax=Cellulomonas fimi (strain ATCC 484 / DSM 20113 / JCM 1341 / CCUG 24087 / LMG 16345 / NBRC 15513 / NCIMB 8980 / NCTC 7547 / NRS-133) TaxID=590998 RepID=F4H1R9_CELFA|nr:FUSC family protein [Cellulomonas fimi]AEE47489.1 membrane protein-like protein [Cellulomonas fimi ATCC 484]NNH05534.1 FUSC family protein [Cellulomonas fimi]VEH36361.1 Predicted membrane protein [Cellulomonas fimi]